MGGRKKNFGRMFAKKVARDAKWMAKRMAREGMSLAVGTVSGFLSVFNPFSRPSGERGNRSNGTIDRRAAQNPAAALFPGKEQRPDRIHQVLYAGFKLDLVCHRRLSGRWRVYLLRICCGVL